MSDEESNMVETIFQSRHIRELLLEPIPSCEYANTFQKQREAENLKEARHQ